MLKAVFLTLGILVSHVAGAMSGDSFEIIRDGKTYFCQDSAGVSGCYKACRADNNSFTYCRNSCPKTDGGCWSACRKDNNSFTYCRNQCDTSQPQCWDACMSDNNSFTYCRNQCR